MLPGDGRATESAVDSLRGWAFSLLADQGVCRSPSALTVGRFLHGSRKLLECIRLSALLKGGARSLVEVMERSLLACAPRLITADVLAGMRSKSVAKAAKVGSASLLSRYELSLDLALMMCSKSLWASQDWTRFGHADSSPMGGYDWLWSQHLQVPTGSLTRCFMAVQRTHAWMQSCLGDAVDSRLQDRQVPENVKREFDYLLEHVMEHVNPPSSLGSGFRGLAHKVGNMVFSWSLQSARGDELRKIPASFRSHTSDMGVELGIPDFHVRDVSTLLPPWMSDANIGRDLEVDDGDVVRAAEAVQDCDHLSAGVDEACMDSASDQELDPPMDERQEQEHATCDGVDKFSCRTA